MAATGLIKPLALAATATSAALAGAIASISLVALPAVLAAPTADLVTLQWRTAYARGMALMPKIAGASFALCLTGSYLVYRAAGKPLSQNTRALYFIGAGVATVGIVPFTLGVVAPTNNRLFALQDATAAGAAGTEVLGEVVSLVQSWGVYNLVRACFPLLGSVLAMQAV